jgi:hypothetical protein
MNKALKNLNLKTFGYKFIAFSVLYLLSGCDALNNSYSRPYDSRYDNRSGGYYDPYARDPYQNNNDYYYQQEAQRRERDRLYNEQRRLDHERNRIEGERERLRNEERQNLQNQYTPPPPPPRPREERCPSGFQPSENKCSREERRRGCQDMRLPGGLGCVKR